MNFRRLFPIVLAVCFGFGAQTSSSAETIAVIGTGSVGSALGPRFAEIGYTVVYGSRTPGREDVRALVAATSNDATATTPSKAAQMANIVLLAVPWTAAEDVLINLGDLSGKIIIDPVNPRVITEEGLADYPTHVSNAERMQALAPRSKVVKAFSTFSADTMADPGLVNHPITVPIAGNDPDAKSLVADICHRLGFETIDFGPVRYAHIIEGFYLLRINARRDDIYFEWNYPRSKRVK
ncbi:MAG: NADPH-dependent F420 reductase [Betaproteobacteria bacterium]|nr:MAG: NADPH-dependent F420 reductase [Betaproteobacteria bacterium]